MDTRPRRQELSGLGMQSRRLNAQQTDRSKTAKRGGEADLGGLADDAFDLLLVGLGDLGAVLGAHEHRGVLERGLLEPGALALDHRRRQDRHDVRRELGDRVRHAAQHARARRVVALLDQRLDQHVRVQQHQRVLQLARHRDVLRVQVLLTPAAFLVSPEHTL
eukprot:2463703-Rhodomonas_salina.10